MNSEEVWTSILKVRGTFVHQTLTEHALSPDFHHEGLKILV